MAYAGPAYPIVIDMLANITPIPSKAPENIPMKIIPKDKVGNSDSPNMFIRISKVIPMIPSTIRLTIVEVIPSTPLLTAKCLVVKLLIPINNVFNIPRATGIRALSLASPCSPFSPDRQIKNTPNTITTIPAD